MTNRLTACRIEFAIACAIFSQTPLVADVPPGLNFGWGASGRNYGQASPPGSTGLWINTSAGMNHSVGVRADGSVVAWGSNWTNQCAVPSDLGPCKQVAAGGGTLYNGDELGHSLALRTDGRVVAWGNNNLGQINLPWDLGTCSLIAAGQYHSLAVRINGQIAAWGDNTYGACNAPSQPSAWMGISGGGRHSLALRSDGVAISWGNNEFGQASIPSSGSGFRKVAAGRNHSAAISGSGGVLAWGYNADGRCTVPTDLGACIDIAAGWFHTVALRTDGRVRAWGANDNGQLNVPTDLGPCSQVTAGAYHSLALKTGNDCNKNGVDDYFDIGGGIPDLNADMIPDTCQGLHAYDQTSPDLGAPIGGVLASHQFVDLLTPVSYGSVALTIRAKADLDATNELLTLRLAGTVVASLFAADGLSCASGISEKTIIVPKAQMTTALASGALLVQILPSPAVTGSECPDGSLTVRLNYLGFGRDADCDLNGLFDIQEIGARKDLDCDGNLLLDRCQIAADPSLDCNANATLDACEISSGSPDEDQDGRPDSCQYALGDFDLNHLVDSGDLAILLMYFGDPFAPFGDLDGDRIIGFGDLAVLLMGFGPA